jgi:hypothetical protein
MPSANLDLRMADLFRTSVFIWDEERKTAWLCPQILLIVHMLRLYLIQLGQNPLLDNITFPIHDVDQQISYHSTAIHDLQNVQIQGGYTYGDIIIKLSDLYDEAFSNLVNVQRNGPCDHLLGFELKHLLHPGQTISPKLLPIKGGIQSWSALVEMGDIIVCRGLGDAISSTGVNGGGYCPHAENPIAGQNILVCPIYLLKEMLAANGCIIHQEYGYAEKKGVDGYKWVITGTPFQCTAERTKSQSLCWSNRLQRVAHVSRLIQVTGPIKQGFTRIMIQFHSSQESVRTMYSNILSSRRGAICFGQLQ